jgi:FkbM family methyltransferase
MSMWSKFRIVNKPDRAEVSLSKFYYFAKQNREKNNTKLLPKVGFITDWNSFPAMIGKYSEHLTLFEIWKLISFLQNENEYIDDNKRSFSSPKNALDIGAHIGNHALFFSQYFNKVYAFEPDPMTFALLKINSTGHNICPYPYGLSDYDGESGFVINQNSRGESYLNKKSDFKVEVKTLDTIQNQLGEIALIKIDAEGHEYEVLKGGKSLIINNLPIILFEWNKLHGQDYDDRIVKYLTSLDYEFYWFTHALRPSNKLKQVFFYVRRFTTGQVTHWTKSQKLPKNDINLVVAIHRK